MKPILFLLQIIYPLLLQCLLASTPVQADEAREKNWSLGVGVGSLYGPDYRGSNEYRAYTAPIPYVVYHGKFIRSDRDGVRAHFFSSDTLDFSLSATAFIVPDADKNTKREGMPELGSTLELGPSLNIRLTGNDLQQGWNFRLPWRGVYAIGGANNEYVGSVLQPQLVYKNRVEHWSFAYRASLLFSSNRYHDYYYRVAPQYVSANRAYYEAHGGYSGWSSEISLSRSLTISQIDTRLAFYIRYDNLSNTDFISSPLVETDHSLRGGLALIWVIQ